MDVRTICVVGAGNMGHQIAVLCAIHGYETYCTDVSETQIARAREFAERYLPERVQKGRLSQEQADAALRNLKFVKNLKEAASNADLVIEAIVERLEAKRELFATLDMICPSHTILATNSSTFVSSLLAGSTKRPDKVLNVHFFNPALVMKVVEIVKGPHTSEDTVATCVLAMQNLGKIPIVLRKEVEGFIVNRIVGAIQGEALRLADMGVASPQEIDLAIEGGLNHPMGPFRLMDLTGIDLAYTIMQSQFERTGNPAFKPPSILEEKYKAGHYGRKTGKGWYDYNSADKQK